MSAVTTACLAILCVAGLLCVTRLVRGSSLADRVIALDSLLVTIVSGVAVQAARSGRGTFLDVLVVAALIAFIGTVTVARFIEHRGAR